MGHRQLNYRALGLAQQARFGASSEGYPGQGELFNEAEQVVEQDEPEQLSQLEPDIEQLLPWRFKLS